MASATHDFMSSSRARCGRIVQPGMAALRARGASLSARYAALVSGWNGEMDNEFRRKARGLRLLCQDIVELRRGDHTAERLRLDLERFTEANKDDEVRALEMVIAEVKEWPDVRQAFQDAFALQRQKKNRGAPACPPVAVPNGNQTGSS
jgi:hypothetical protein